MPDDEAPPAKKSADGVWTQTPLGTAKPMTSETMAQVFGRHPDADWRYIPEKGPWVGRRKRKRG